jgi:hypothetical protein
VAQKSQARRHWRKLLALAFVLPVPIWATHEYFVPDDAESKFSWLRIGMTEAEVDAVMARRNVLTRLVLGKGQRVRRASGVTSLWTETWYQGDEKMTGVYFRWDEDGRLARRAIWKDGNWIEATD